MFILDDYFKPSGLSIQKVFEVAANADPAEEGLKVALSKMRAWLLEELRKSQMNEDKM